MRRDVCMRLRYLACDTIHLLGAIGADCVREGTRAKMVASAPVGDAEVMPGLGSVPLGRWKSATEER